MESKTINDLGATEVQFLHGEFWRAVENTSERYWVSNVGRLLCTNWKGTGRKRVMVPSPDHKGYLRTMIKTDEGYKTVKIHRLVAKAWLPEQLGKTHVDHINSIKTDNRCENLAWVTQHENTMKAFDEGRFFTCSGEKNGCSKLNDDKVREIRRLFKEGKTRKEIAPIFGVAPATVKNVILRGWKHVK